MIRNAKNTVVYSKHFIGDKLDERDLFKKLDFQVSLARDWNLCFNLFSPFLIKFKVKNENEVAFLVEKNDKSYEMSLCEVLEKQIKFLNGKIN